MFGQKILFKARFPKKNKKSKVIGDFLATDRIAEI